MNENVEQTQEKMDKELKQAKEMLNNKLVELLGKFILLTTLHKMEWKESSEDGKFFWGKESLVFYFGLEKSNASVKNFEIKIINTETSKTNLIKDINENDGAVYKKSLELYSAINQSQVQHDVNAVDMFLKDL